MLIAIGGARNTARAAQSTSIDVFALGVFPALSTVKKENGSA
jgi:hypothetical protein